MTSEEEEEVVILSRYCTGQQILYCIILNYIILNIIILNYIKYYINI